MWAASSVLTFCSKLCRRKVEENKKEGSKWDQSTTLKHGFWYAGRVGVSGTPETEFRSIVPEYQTRPAYQNVSTKGHVWKVLCVSMSLVVQIQVRLIQAKTGKDQRNWEEVRNYQSIHRSAHLQNGQGVPKELSHCGHIDASKSAERDGRQILSASSSSCSCILGHAGSCKRGSCDGQPSVLQ